MPLAKVKIRAVGPCGGRAAERKIWHLVSGPLAGQMAVIPAWNSEVNVLRRNDGTTFGSVPSCRTVQSTLRICWALADVATLRLSRCQSP